jgi:hypothetical protein
LEEAGIEWVIIPNDRKFRSHRYHELIADFGELRFADRNWSLMRLQTIRNRPKRYEQCSSDLLAGDCWHATGLDAVGGLTAEEAGSGAWARIPACPGRTIVLKVAVSSGVTPAAAAITFDDDDPWAGFTSVSVPAGTSRTIAATAPQGSSLALVTLRPGDGGVIERATVGWVGGECPEEASTGAGGQ